MKKGYNNIRVMAENCDSKPGFNIYLDFSGSREYLMTHRHNGLMYAILKDGMYVRDLRRWRPNEYVKDNKRRNRSNASVQVEGMMKHLLLAVEDYMAEREAC